MAQYENPISECYRNNAIWIVGNVFSLPLSRYQGEMFRHLPDFEGYEEGCRSEDPLPRVDTQPASKSQIGPGMDGNVITRIGTRRDIEWVQEQIHRRIRDRKIEWTFSDF
jgi:hypothetical protein